MRALLILTLTVAPPAIAGPATLASGSSECRAASLELTPGDGVTPARATALSEVVTREVAVGLTHNGVRCEVLDRAAITNMLDFEAERQAVGCSDEDCLAEIGDALGVTLLVTGSIAVLEGSHLVSLRVMNLEKARVEARVTESETARPGDGKHLIDFVAWTARKLVTGEPGERPKGNAIEPRVVERRPTIYRQLAWGSTATAVSLGVLAAAFGGTTLGLNLALPNLKTARQPDVDLIDSIEANGPWVASAANLSLYAAVAVGITATTLFFFPGEQLEAAP